MRIFARLASLGRNLFRSERVDQRLREELEAHFDLLVDQKLEQGLPLPEARRLARLEMGGVEQVAESVRDAQTGRLLEELWRDLRYAARALRRSPGFTAVVVLMLALGIGVNDAIFRLVNALWLRPLPIPDPAQLVLLSDGEQPGQRFRGTPPMSPPGRLFLYSYPLYQRLRDLGDSFAGLAAQESASTPSLVEARGYGARSAERADGRAVSASYFEVLGVPAHRGRTFSAQDETAPGANPVLVVSHGFWQRRFLGDPALLGGRLTVNGTPYTVVGITPPGFTGAEIGSVTDFWVPLTMQAELTRFGLDSADPNYYSLLVLGRLQPGVSLAAAEANADRVFQAWLTEDPLRAREADRAPVHVRLASGARGISPLRDRFHDALLVLLVAGGVLFSIVCLNVAHLLLARALHRQREMATRLALGAGRGRLVRQLLIEGLLLAGLGAAGGLLAGKVFRTGLLALAAEGVWELPLALDLAADFRVVSLLVGLAVATAVVVGLAPAWHAARTDLQAVLRASSPALGGGGSRRRWSRLLLVSQVAFSLVLLVAAGLLAASLQRLREVRSGLDPKNVLLAELDTQMAGLEKPRALSLYEEVRRRVAALPGVRAVSLSLGSVMGAPGFSRLRFAVQFPEGDLPVMSVQTYFVTPGYFETLGMTFARGRGFQGGDHSQAAAVGVVNETLAEHVFGSPEAALGKRFRGNPSDGPWMQIVGVVRDARVNGLRQRVPPVAYYPATQPRQSPVQLFLSNLEVRTTSDPILLVEPLRRALSELRPALPLRNVRTLRDQVDRSLMQERLLANLSSAFGLAALFLVCIGLYALIAQWASQRTWEIGVRMALGATTTRVRWLVLRQALALVLAGITIGLPAAALAATLLQKLLFGITPLDPTALTMSTLTLLSVAMLAAYVPAHRASRTPPMTALRCE